MAIDIESDARYPLTSEDAARTLLLGTVLSLFMWLIIPALPLWGYFLRVIRGSIEGTDEPPVFDDWEDLTREGVVAVVVFLIYQLLPIIIALVILAIGIGIGATGTETVRTVGGIVSILSILVWGVLQVIAGYLTPAAIANVAREQQIKAGFDVGLIRDVVLTQAYLVHWLYAICVSLVIGFVASAVGGIIGLPFSLLGLIPIIGLLFLLVAFTIPYIIGTAIGFYGQMVIMRIWGEGYVEALEEARGSGAK